MTNHCLAAPQILLGHASPRTSRCGLTHPRSVAYGMSSNVSRNACNHAYRPTALGRARWAKVTGAAKGSVRDAAEISDGASDEAWELEYLFDGACSICRNLKRSLEVADKAGRVHFVDISSLDYRPEEHMGISYEKAMEKIHVVTRSGGVLKGQEALNALYDAVGWGWVTTATRAVPALGWIAGRAVDAVSALRLPLSGKTIANLSAIRRAQQEQAGDAECAKNPDVECEADLDFDDVPDLAELAKHAAEEDGNEGKGRDRH